MQNIKKRVLVTGTGRGIGHATALQLLKEGYNVVGTSVSGINTIVHPEFTNFKLDITDPDDIKQLEAAIQEAGWGIDILINNAGYGGDVGKTKPDQHQLRQTFEVNVHGLVQLTETLIPYIPEGGQILMLSSLMSLLHQIQPDSPAYRMSKAAVNVYVKMLSQRLAPAGIAVNALEPGWVRTDMGGPDAPVSPEEAAVFICHVLTLHKGTGNFWQSKDKQCFQL